MKNRNQMTTKINWSYIYIYTRVWMQWSLRNTSEIVTVITCKYGRLSAEHHNTVLYLGLYHQKSMVSANLAQRSLSHDNGRFRSGHRNISGYYRSGTSWFYDDNCDVFLCRTIRYDALHPRFKFISHARNQCRSVYKLGVYFVSCNGVSKTQLETKIKSLIQF